MRVSRRTVSLAGRPSAGRCSRRPQSRPMVKPIPVMISSSNRILRQQRHDDDDDDDDESEDGRR